MVDDIVLVVSGENLPSVDALHVLSVMRLRHWEQHTGIFEVGTVNNEELNAHDGVRNWVLLFSYFSLVSLHVVGKA